MNSIKKTLASFSACALLIAPVIIPALANAEAVPGKAAPAFDLKDASGKSQKLSDYAGKWVVLEWSNKDCPYVKKHYGAGNMQKLQKDYTAKGVTWFTVLSSAKGKQGYLEPAEAVKTAKENKSSASAILLDADGKVGTVYGAKTTPHMFVIDPKGNVAYAGGIDDNDSADAAVIPKSKNFVSAALDAGMAGKKIETTSARPYGCSVKY
ncbi:MAG: thioredoxin family protein [Bdellovibrionaceae bacterium]|nr:thioredoxin family protein [Pseudobdellovibrionaceae bacterium]